MASNFNARIVGDNLLQGQRLYAVSDAQHANDRGRLSLHSRPHLAEVLSHARSSEPISNHNLRRLFRMSQIGRRQLYWPYKVVERATSSNAMPRCERFVTPSQKHAWRTRERLAVLGSKYIMGVNPCTRTWASGIKTLSPKSNKIWHTRRDADPTSFCQRSGTNYLEEVALTVKSWIGYSWNGARVSRRRRAPVSLR